MKVAETVASFWLPWLQIFVGVVPFLVIVETGDVLILLAFLGRGVLGITFRGGGITLLLLLPAVFFLLFSSFLNLLGGF